MYRLSSIFALFATLIVATNAFAPSTPLAVARSITPAASEKTVVNMGFGLGDGDEPKKLTRENEPDEYFSSKLDEMSDSEKLPIALGGLAFISLPFIAGLIALYSSK